MIKFLMQKKTQDKHKGKKSLGISINQKLIMVFILLVVFLLPGIAFGSNLQDQVGKMPEVGEAMNFLVYLYTTVKDLLLLLLKKTLFQANPAIIDEYGNVITLLVSVTAGYVVLTSINIGKRLIGWLLLLGWLLLGISLVIRFFT